MRFCNRNTIVFLFSPFGCDNIRIPRANIYDDEEFRGYNASKRRYFYGLKIHLLVTQDGEPVEFFFTPGAVNDTKALEAYVFDLPFEDKVFFQKTLSSKAALFMVIKPITTMK